MNGKVLGKIDFAEFGTNKDYPFLIGMQLGFRLGDESAVGDGGKYTVHINFDNEQEKIVNTETVAQNVKFIHDILKDAKVSYISELINKPVVVTIENDCFKDFRILTEVL